MKTYSPITNAKAKALPKVYNINVSNNFFILCAFIVFQKTFTIQLDIQTLPITTGKGTLWSKHSFLITNETVQICLHKYKCLQKVEEQ